MQDRFKFRVWLNKLNRYSKNTDNLLLSEDGNVCEFDTVGCYSEKDVVIQQCTGLKDRNGKLIYEGDIVKYTDCEGKETIGYLAIDRFNLLTFANMVNCDFCEEWADVVKAVFFTGNSTIEVIGNIYENKELLGEQK